MSSNHTTPGASHAAQSRLVASSPNQDSSRAPSRPGHKRPPHRSTLEPPVNNHRQERSSSPRLHAANSPSLLRRRRRRPSPGVHARSEELGAASTADLDLSPPRYVSPSPPHVWPDDDISLPRLQDDPTDRVFAPSGWSPDALNHFNTSDLSDLANNTFSSPSTYPSFTTTASTLSSRPENANNTNDSDMPTATRRRSTTAMPASSPPAAGRLSHPAHRHSGPPAKKIKIDVDEADPFKSSSPPANEEAIDLTDPTISPEQAARSRKSPPKVKLASFQCAICLDNVESMTVTHCGHIFCAQCLHSSLCVESTKGRCPMCRAKIDIKPREDYTSKTKGFYPMELKLMTKSRKGKRKVGDAL